MSTITIRNLTTFDEFKQVMELERQVWGFSDILDMVPPVVFRITVKRGAILLGAFDERDRMVGFSYSLVGMKPGKVLQWSHMTGVLPEYRGGLGHRLKLEQRQRALALGYDLIEWTFDPLQALNAHVNFAKLGVVVRAYELNVYGASSSPLHRGTPTDRFVAEWWLQRLHVRRRIAPHAGEAPRAHEVFDAPSVNRTRQAGEWLECAGVDLGLNGPRLFVEVPPNFADMTERSPDLALDWRMKTREIFTACFARGYRAVDFFLDRHTRQGRYLLALEEPDL